MSDASDTSTRPPRTLSVSDVARRRGIEPRTVRRWCDPRGAYMGRLCPHDRVPARVGGNDNGEVIRLNIDEVNAWCEAHGVGKARSSEDRERNEHGPVEYTVGGEVVGPRREAIGEGREAGSGDAGRESGLEGGASALGPLPSALLPGDERAAVRAQIEALAGVVHELQVGVAQFKRDGKLDGLSPTQLQQAISAATKASQEIRQLDAQELARQKARGELVERHAAEAVLRRGVDLVLSGLESLRQELPAEMRRAGCQIGEGEARATDEVFDRMLVAALGSSFDALRRSVADGLAAMAGPREDGVAA